jgi:3-oxoacyl-(acyl-carrier-protein) synthase
MDNRVVISRCAFRAPGMDNLKSAWTAMNDDTFAVPFEEVTICDDRKIFGATIDLDQSSPHFPNRSKLKLMRSDVVAALICAGELLDQARLADMIDVPLYVSNGSSFDLSVDQVAKVTDAYLDKSDNEAWPDRYKRLNMILPPLLALKTLAITTECFVAEKLGAKGDNATFGSTAHSAYYALLEGVKKIRQCQSDMVVVGASNGIGIYSSLIYKNFPRDGLIWKESEGAAFLLLESVDSCRRHGRQPLAEIVGMESKIAIPEIFSEEDNSPYQDFIGDPAPMCIFSGGLSYGDFMLEEQVCQSNWSGSFCWKSKLGILGNVGIIMNIITAITLFKHKDPGRIDCLNRDPYGRESRIRLQAEVN